MIHTPTAALDALNEISGRIYSLLNQLVDDKSAPVWSNVKSDIETIRTVLQNAPEVVTVEEFHNIALCGYSTANHLSERYPNGVKIVGE